MLNKHSTRILVSLHLPALAPLSEDTLEARAASHTQTHIWAHAVYLPLIRACGPSGGSPALAASTWLPGRRARLPACVPTHPRKLSC